MKVMNDMEYKAECHLHFATGLMEGLRACFLSASPAHKVQILKAAKHSLEQVLEFAEAEQKKLE